jgi:hypothetical protein
MDVLKLALRHYAEFKLYSAFWDSNRPLEKSPKVDFLREMPQISTQ